MHIECPVIVLRNNCMIIALIDVANRQNVMWLFSVPTQALLSDQFCDVNEAMSHNS